MKRAVIVLIAVVLLLGANQALASSSPAYHLDWITQLDSSGGGETSSPNYRLAYSLGQITGLAGSQNFYSCLGYWCSDYQVQFTTYLPLAPFVRP